MLTDLRAGDTVSTMAEGLTDEEVERKLGPVCVAALRLLRQHPEGLDIKQITERIEVGGDQTWLNKRVRELRKYFHVPGHYEGKRFVYVYGGPKDNPQGDTGAISGRLAAEVLNLAKGRCQMCGKTVAEDGIKLQIDHKVPQTWGGLTVLENLWAICMPCNNGKRDHFASFDAEEMAELLAIESVHLRIAHFLKMHMGEAVDSNVVEFVANATERQEDWQKRLRELRYPVIGLDIESGRYRTPQGFTRSTYKLLNWREFPPNWQRLIRDWENPTKRAAIKQQLGIS